jgi:oxygen-independent coproporphyrinogen-3 oxidase
VADDAEITMEANPDTVSADYLEAMRALGVNRLSFGVQSANATELQFLERTHSFETVVEAVAMSREAGFDNLNLDLIYGLPHQSLASWEQSLQAVLALEPEHLSLYCLIVEQGTPLQRWLTQGRVQLPDPDLAADQYELAIALLEKHGFGHYEISNWAREGRECRHNLQYWRNQPYLGLGAGAHGYANGIRYHVVKQPRVYIKRLQSETMTTYPLSTAAAGHNILTQEEAMQDTIITQLRLLQEGLNLPAFTQHFQTPLEQAYKDILPDLYNWNLIQKKGDKLLLTPHGTLLSNQVFYRFM